MKTAIFIDGKTLFYGLKDKRINFNNFKSWLLEKNKDNFSGYFNCLDNVNSKQSFFGHIFKSGFKIFIRNPIKNYNDDTIAFNLSDVELTTEDIKNKDKYQKFILVSGKNDFLPLVEELATEGKEIEIVGFKDNVGAIFSKYKIRYIEKYLEENENE